MFENTLFLQRKPNNTGIGGQLLDSIYDIR